MSTPQPTEFETAQVIIWQPGNGTRYKIVYGRDFVALPDWGVAATCTPWPNEYGYLKSKLDLRNDEDAKQVFEALRSVSAPTHHFEHLDGSVCEDETQYLISPEDKTLFVCDAHDRRTKKVGP